MLHSQNDRQKNRPNLWDSCRGMLCSGQTLAGLVASGSLFVAGCSQEPSSTTANAGSTNSVAAGADTVEAGGATGNSGAQTAGKGRQRGRDEVYEDEKGQKWFGQVPYDVFFDKPLEVAQDTTPIGGGSSDPAGNAASTPAVASTESNQPEMSATDNPGTEAPPSNTATANAGTTAASDPPAATAGGEDGWKDLISVTVIDAEVKNIRNFFNETLQSVGSFNSSMLMLPPKAASLAVMAGVAMEHPDSVSWKDDAIYVRDLAKKMNASTLQRGAKDQKRLLELFEAINDTLNRSRPAGLEEPSASDSFPEVAEMRLVMARMEEAEKRMKTEAGSQGAFQNSKEMVKHEAAILATLTHTVAMPGYGYGDDPKFVGFTKNIVDAAKSILTAADADDFATYELALSKISTNCNACHSDYKND